MKHMYLFFAVMGAFNIALYIAQHKYANGVEIYRWVIALVFFLFGLINTIVNLNRKN